MRLRRYMSRRMELMKHIKAFLHYLWSYMGTIAALSLMLGVLGMAVYHLFVREPGQEYRQEKLSRSFLGIYNSSAPEQPEGIGAVTYGNCSCMQQPGVCFVYRDDGKVERVSMFDAAGELAPLPGSKVAEQRIEYDKFGRIVAKRNFDESGHPAADAQGVASRLYEYTESGQLSRTILLGEDGKKIVPSMPGYAEETITYDAQERPLDIHYSGADGCPITNAQGKSHIQYRYEDDTHSSTCTNSVDGNAADDCYGVAVEQKRYDDKGENCHTAWLNAAGEPVAHPLHGAFIVQKEHFPLLHSCRTRLCDAAGELLSPTHVCCEQVVRVDGQGRPVRVVYNGKDGLPCYNPALKCAECEFEYTADGKVKRALFWDARGNPAECFEKRFYYEGPLCYELALYSDGSTSWQQMRDNVPQSCCLWK